MGSPNGKCVFTAEKVRNGVEVCAYGVGAGERKAFRMSDMPNYVPVDVIDSITLLTD